MCFNDLLWDFMFCFFCYFWFVVFARLGSVVLDPFLMYVCCFLLCSGSVCVMRVFCIVWCVFLNFLARGCHIFVVFVDVAIYAVNIRAKISCVLRPVPPHKLTPPFACRCWWISLTLCVFGLLFALVLGPRLRSVSCRDFAFSCSAYMHTNTNKPVRDPLCPAVPLTAFHH